MTSKQQAVDAKWTWRSVRRDARSFLVRDLNTDPVAIVPFRDDQDEEKSARERASVIAMAPTMLDALVKVRDYLIQRMFYGSSTNEETRRVEQIVSEALSYNAEVYDAGHAAEILIRETLAIADKDPVVAIAALRRRAKDLYRGPLNNKEAEGGGEP